MTHIKFVFPTQRFIALNALIFSHPWLFGGTYGTFFFLLFCYGRTSAALLCSVSFIILSLLLSAVFKICVIESRRLGNTSVNLRSRRVDLSSNHRQFISKSNLSQDIVLRYRFPQNVMSINSLDGKRLSFITADNIRRPMRALISLASVGLWVDFTVLYFWDFIAMSASVWVTIKSIILSVYKSVQV